MKKTNFIFILSLAGFLLTLLTGCTNCSNTPQVTTNEMTPTLLVVIDDPSSTDKGNDLTKAQYHELTNMTFNRQVGDAIFVLSAGDVLKQDEVISFASSKKPIVPKEAILRVKRVLNNKADSMKLVNQGAINDFLTRIDALIVNYKPARKDITNLDRPFQLANMIFCDSQYSNYNKVLAIVSDGIHENNYGKAIPMKVQLNQQQLTVIQTGWTQDRACFGTHQIQDKADAQTLFSSLIQIFK
jgi:hypothetical protein